MSSTSKKAGAVPTVKPRLITVGRGKAPLVPTVPRPGPSNRSGGLPVPESSSAQQYGAVPKSVQARAVVQDENMNEDSLLGLRRPKQVRQEPSVLYYQSYNLLNEDNHHIAGLKEQIASDSSLMTEYNKMGGTERKEKQEFEQMKEELAVFKEESGANLDFLKKQVEKLEKENDKDLEIKRLKNELFINQKLLEIQVNIKAKKENVMPAVSPPPPVNTFQFSHLPPPDVPVTPPFRRFSVPQPVSPPDYRRQHSPPPPVPGLFPPGCQSAQQAASPQLHHEDWAASLLTPLPPSSSYQSTAAEEIDSAVRYYSSDEDQGIEVDGIVYNVSLIRKQEELFRQLEEKKRKEKLAESQSLQLIQQLSIEDDLNRAPSSGSSNRTNHQTSSSESFNPNLFHRQVEDDSWTRVAKHVRRPSGAEKQEKAKKEQKDMEERQRRQWEEFRKEMRDKEEKERENILKSNQDNQKLRMIHQGSISSVVGGPSKSPALSSAAPVKAMTLGDVVAAGRRQKTAPKQKITPRSQKRQAEVSEFEAERRRAANELKKRIEAQGEERRRRIQIERLEREWDLARERCDHQEINGNNAGKGSSAVKKRFN